MSLHYKIIKDCNNFEEVKEEWNSLLAHSSSNTIFLTWEWQFSWWKSFGGELFIILIYERKDLLAILPFLISRKLGFHVLKFIGAPDSDYLGFIIKKSFERIILDYFLNDFLSNNSRIGIIELHSINETSPLYLLINDVVGNDFNVNYSKKICPYISLPGTYDAYLKSLSSGMRYYIKRKRRKLYRDYCVNVGFVCTKEDLEKRMTDFILQHQKRWNTLHKPGAFSNNSFEDFHLKVGKRLLQKGWLKLYYLELNNHPVASYYLFHYKNALYYYLSGFEPEYGKYSPGVVLMEQAISDAINEGLDKFDLMRGEESYKFKWTSQRRFNHTFILKRKRLSVLLDFLINSSIKKTALLIKMKIAIRVKDKIVNIFAPYFNV